MRKHAPAPDNVWLMGNAEVGGFRVRGGGCMTEAAPRDIRYRRSLILIEISDTVRGSVRSGELTPDPFLIVASSLRSDTFSSYP
jgi:hypothetical protein